MEGSSPSKSLRRADRRMFLVVAAMVAVWLLIVLCRNPIRAHWWARRLAASTDPEVRLACFQRLVALGPTGAAGVERLLRNDDAAIRGLGVAVVNHTRPKQARSHLSEMMHDPDAEVAFMAVTGLALLGDPAVIDDLARLLESPEPRVQVLAVTGLSRLRTSAAVDLLIETARDPGLVAPRVQAIEELGQLQVERAVDILTECLGDETPFEGVTVSERSAFALLTRTAPGMAVEPPPTTRPVSYFAARALRAITGEEIENEELKIENEE